jgi:hypothetical protein
MIYVGETRRRARWRWLVPVSAAATAAIFVSQSVTGIQPVSFASALSNGAPRYYVTVHVSGKKLQAQVRNSTSGKVISSVSLPVTVGTGTTWQIAGASDDRHFVVAVPVYGKSSLTLYTISLSRIVRPVLGKHWTAKWNGTVFQSLALSPTGTSAALGFTSFAQMTGSVTVVNLGTGKSKTWSGAQAPGYLPGDLSFVGNADLAVPWLHYLSYQDAVLAGVRTLNLNKAAGSLLTAKLVTFRKPPAVPASAIVTANGKDIIASTCQAPSGKTVTAKVEELSASDGHVIRVLTTQKMTFSAPGSASNKQPLLFLTCPVLSVDGTGQHVLVEAFTFGRLDNTKFRKLPGQSGSFAAAW